MKKLMYLIPAIVFVLIMQSKAHAVTLVPTVNSLLKTTPSINLSPSVLPTSAVSKDIQDLKDKLATKVAELKKTNQKAISGVIQEMDGKTITIKNRDDKIYKVKLDDVLTHAYVVTGVTKKEVKPDTLKKGDYIIVAGPYTDDTVTANAIYKDDHYIVGSGKITTVNKSDFSLQVATADKENLTIDVDNGTKRLLIDSKTLSKEPIGFTKIKEGDTVHYVLKKTGQEKVKDRYSALRIVIIPQEYFITK